MEKTIITLVNAEGKNIEAEMLLTHYSEEFKKNYVVLRIIEEDTLTAGVYTPGLENGEITAIETDEEWDMIEELLDDYFSHENCSCGCDDECSCGCNEGEECSCGCDDECSCCCDENEECSCNKNDDSETIDEECGCCCHHKE